MPVLVNIASITDQQLLSICDHTFLQPAEAYKQHGVDASALRKEAFFQFLAEAVRVRPYAVCVRPQDVPHAAEYFATRDANDIVVASVVGFPDGVWCDTGLKVAEATYALQHGAKEIDMVLDFASFLAGDEQKAEADARVVAECVHGFGGKVKLILETSQFPEQHRADLLRRACDLAIRAGVDFVKTSTGYGAAGACATDVALLRKHFPGGVKASGGITHANVHEILVALSGRGDGKVLLDPLQIRIGEAAILK